MSDARRDWRERAEAVKARCDLADVAGRYVTLRRDGHDLVGLTPFKSERTPSFRISPRRQVWYCFASSQGGDVIDLVAKVERIPRHEAIRRLEAGDGPADPAATERRLAEVRRHREAETRKEAEARRRKAELAIEIWDLARPADGSPVEAYLEWRGIDLDPIAALYGHRVPPTLRFVPDLAYHVGRRVVHRGPAMVGVLTRRPPATVGAGPSTVVAVHRTWLAPGGEGKLDRGLPAKLTLGPVSGAGGWLTGEHPHLIVGEGYETTLSVLAALARRGERVAAASAVSLSNLAGAGCGVGVPHPDGSGRRLPSPRPDPARLGFMAPRGVRQVTVLADADSRDPAMVDALLVRAVAKLRAQGALVRLARPEAGTDFNDMLRAGGSRDVARAVDLAA